METANAPGRLVFAQPFPFAGRIFGLLFTIPGIKLGWDLVNALREIARANAWQLSDVFAVGIWLLFALVFLVPGWLIATIRRRVEIDRVGHAVQQVNDFGIYRWTSSRPLSDFKEVRLYVPKTSSTSKRVGASVHVELTPTRGQSPVMVFMDDDEARARSIADDVTRATGLTLRNDLGRIEQDEEEETDVE